MKEMVFQITEESMEFSINGTDTNDSPYKGRKKEERKNGFLPQILQKNQ